MAVSGALYAFEPQLRIWWGEAVTPVDDAESLRSPEALGAGLRAQGMEGEARWFLWPEDRRLPAWVGWETPAGDALDLMVDPVHGALLPRATAVHRFFRTVLDVHRALTLGETGRLIVGSATLILVASTLSGLFLGVRRWREARQVWFPKRRERATPVPRLRWRLWHRLIGAWATPWLLVVAATGLVWAFTWYANALKQIGGPPRFSHAPTLVEPVAEGSLAWEALWQTALATRTGNGAMRLMLPRGADQPVRFEWSPPGALSAASRSRLFLHPQTAEVIGVQQLEEFSFGERLVRWAYPVHTGLIAGFWGQLGAALGSLTVPFFFASGIYLWRARRRTARRATTLSKTQPQPSCFESTKSCPPRSAAS